MVSNHRYGNSLIKEVATIQLGSRNFNKRPWNVTPPLRFSTTHISTNFKQKKHCFTTHTSHAQVYALTEFCFFNSPVPALFASFEVSMLSLKFACFREFFFCSVAAKFANLHAPTRFFGQRSFAIFISSRVCSIRLRELVNYCVLPTTRSLYGLLSFLWS